MSSSSDSDGSSSSEPKSKVTKRPRIPFGTYDNSVLLELVEKYKSSIESKKTDFGTIDKKRAAWNKLVEEFNADPNTKKRDMDQLKKRWENMKSKAKKETCNFKKKQRKTGGGKKPKDLSEITEKVTSIIPQQMTSLENPYDCDSIDGLDETDQYKQEACSSTSSKESRNLKQTKPSCIDETSCDENLLLTDLKSKPTVSKNGKTREPRTYLIDWEYEEHKARLETAKTTLRIEQERLQASKNFTNYQKEEHLLRMEILQAELLSKNNKE